MRVSKSFQKIKKQKQVNNNNIQSIMIQVAAGFLALYGAFFIFSSGGNVVGKVAVVGSVAAFVIGISNVRAGIILALLCGAYLDAFKRLLIVDSNFGTFDIAAIQVIPVILMLGMVLRLVLGWITKPANIERWQIITFLVITMLGCVLGAAYVFSGEMGMRALGDAANASAYLYLILLVPVYFGSKHEVFTLLKFILIIYVPVAIWALKQGVYGLADFEYDYLISGYTIEVRQLNEKVFRNMGSMVSAAALSMVSSILLAALIIPLRWKDGAFSLGVWFNPARWVFGILFAIGAYYTYSRTGWVCGLAAIVIFMFLQRKITAYGGALLGLSMLVGLYVSADYLYNNKYLIVWQEEIFTEFANSDQAQQALVIGTLEGRLESMREFATNREIWTPFGLAIADKSLSSSLEGDQVHDVMTEFLVKIGYIPMAIMFLGGLWFFMRVMKVNFSFNSREDSRCFRFYLALAGGMLLTGLSQGKMLFIFPTNLFWCLFFGMAFAVYRRSLVLKIQNEKEGGTPMMSYPRDMRS